MTTWEETKLLQIEKESVRVPLISAVLCLDCEVIYMGDSCPACGSKQTLKIASIIPATKTLFTIHDEKGE